MISKIFIIFFLFFATVHSVFAGNSIIVESIGTTQNVESRKHLIQNLFSKPSLDFSFSFLKIVLDVNQKEPRGKIQWKIISLSASIKDQSEFLKLLFHEIGHAIDIYTFIPDMTGFDRSQTFYDISWQDTTTKKAWEKSQNFISGYAATNKYEDFAESFVFYMFHNNDFAERALKNDSLRQKYLFIQRYLFLHGEFTGTDFRINKIPVYFWDTTKIPISVNKYLYSLP